MKIRKFANFTHDVVFIDGLWGTGKSMLAPIVSGMRGVEIQKVVLIFEYLCVLRSLNRIDADAAEAMLHIHADMTQYHNLIGREVNLRWKDDSGPVNNPGGLRYLRRVFGAEGDMVVERINRGNLALNLMTHSLLPVVTPLIEAFGDRLKFIEVVRHPLYMIPHWLAYLSRFESPREFTVSLDFGGSKVPWFAADWHEEYLRLETMDRVLVSIVRLYGRMFETIDRLSRTERLLLVLPFERIALATETVLRQLEAFLGRAHHSGLAGILRRQRLPRDRISHGKGKAKYGWQAGVEESEKAEYRGLEALICKSGSADCVARFREVIAEYNRRWPSALGGFH